MKKYLAFTTAVLLVCLTGCSQIAKPAEPSRETKPAVTETVPPVETAATETQETAPAETVDISGWDEVVELVNRKGETTTVYLLADGRYMDRTEQVFVYDGNETWLLGDEEWNRKPEIPALAWEPAVERFIAQRPDLEHFTDCDGEFSEKYVFWALEDITDFKYQGLAMDVLPDGELTCVNQETMFSLEQIPMDGGVVISLCIEGVLPNRGIQYTDGNGVIHCFCITASGESDNLLLLPYSCG